MKRALILVTLPALVAIAACGRTHEAGDQVVANGNDAVRNDAMADNASTGVNEAAASAMPNDTAMPATNQAAGNAMQ